MNAMQLHDRLYDLGVKLVRDGDTLSGDVRPEADIKPHLDAIQAHKVVLLAVVDLRERIIAAVTADPADFNREAFNALWQEWEAAP